MTYNSKSGKTRRSRYINVLERANSKEGRQTDLTKGNTTAKCREYAWGTGIGF